MQVQPYLFFDGRADEALEFYRRVLGAEVINVIRTQENAAGQAAGKAPPAGKVMHAAFRVGQSVLLASDGMSKGRPEFRGMKLSLRTDDAAEADRLFAALGEGGQVQLAMTSTFFAPRFGMVADKFGVSWMVMFQPAQARAQTQH